MPRPKGVKNRAKEVTIDEKITNLTAEIEAAEAAVKAKKAELKDLKKKQQEMQSQTILNAIATSGKSQEEILQFLGEAKQ